MIAPTGNSGDRSCDRHAPRGMLRKFPAFCWPFPVSLEGVTQGGDGGMGDRDTCTKYIGMGKRRGEDDRGRGY